MDLRSKWGRGDDEQLDASRLSRQSWPLAALSLGGLPIVFMRMWLALMDIEKSHGVWNR